MSINDTQGLTILAFSQSPMMQTESWRVVSGVGKDLGSISYLGFYLLGISFFFNHTEFFFSAYIVLSATAVAALVDSTLNLDSVNRFHSIVTTKLAGYRPTMLTDWLVTSARLNHGCRPHCGGPFLASTRS